MGWAEEKKKEASPMGVAYTRRRGGKLTDGIAIPFRHKINAIAPKSGLFMETIPILRIPPKTLRVSARGRKTPLRHLLAGDFVERIQFRTPEDVDDLVERRAPRERRDGTVGTVLRQLRLRLVDLGGHLRDGGVSPRVLQLHEVTVEDVAVVDALREEAEVAEPAREFHLRREEVELQVAELRLHVALHADLALQPATHGRRLRVVPREALQERLERTIIGEVGGEARPFHPVGHPRPAVGVAQVVEELAADADVRDLEDRLPAPTLLHRDDAVVVEERVEVREVGDPVGGEALDEVERDLARRRELLRDGQDALDGEARAVGRLAGGGGADAAALTPLDVRDDLQLLVVRLDVGVHHVLRRLAPRDERLQVVERHVAVEHALLPDTRRREAVAVVPRLDRLHDRRRVAFRETPRPLEVGIHLQNLGLGEAGHRVELLVLREVRGDVEAARQIVHRHGGDARHEDARAAFLKLLEPVPVEPRPVRDGAVVRVRLVTQHRVREVVVFVDDQVDLESARGRARRDAGELVRRRPVRQRVGEVGAVGFAVVEQEAVEAYGEIALETLLKRPADATADNREVQREHLVLVRVLRRVLADVESAEPFAEVRLLVDVVVGAQRLDEEGLAHAPGAHEEDEAVTLLHPADVGRLVDVVVAFVADTLEVLDAVGDFECLRHIRHSRTFHCVRQADASQR